MQQTWAVKYIVFNKILQRHQKHCHAINSRQFLDRQEHVWRPLFQDNLGKPAINQPMWISIKQELMEWQWHQLDHMQIICTSLHTDNHASTSPLNILQAGCSSCRPTNSVKALRDSQTFGSATAKKQLLVSHLSYVGFFVVETSYDSGQQVTPAQTDRQTDRQTHNNHKRPSNRHQQPQLDGWFQTQIQHLTAVYKYLINLSTNWMLNVCFH